MKGKQRSLHDALTAVHGNNLRLLPHLRLICVISLRAFYCFGRIVSIAGAFERSWNSCIRNKSRRRLNEPAGHSSLIDDGLLPVTAQLSNEGLMLTPSSSDFTTRLKFTSLPSTTHGPNNGPYHNRSFALPVPSHNYFTSA